MRRYELGEHLNLRFESVSRTLNELQKKGAIEMDGAAVKIVSLERLREAAVLHSARPVPYRPRQPRQNSTFTCSE